MILGFDAKRAFTNFTGLGNYSRFVIQALAETFPENEYQLYTPKIKVNADTQLFLNNPIYQVKTPFAITATLKLSSFWRSINLGNVAYKNQVQLFHGLSNELPLTKPKGLKTILTVHDLIFLRYPKFYNSIDVKIYT